MDVLEVLEQLLEAGVDVEEIKKAKAEIEKINGKIEEYRKKIAELEAKKAKVVEKFPEAIRTLILGKKGRKGGNGGGKRKYKVIAPDGRELSVREAYYEIYPEREGKSYKYEDMIKALKEHGYTVEIEE